MKKKLSSGAKWEDIAMYSRAVRVGKHIEISGTTSVLGDKVEGIGDPYRQTVVILEKVRGYLEELECSMDKVIRTRMYTTDMKYWPEIAKAHAEFFEGIRPATSLIEIAGLIDPDMLVEIEVTALDE